MSENKCKCDCGQPSAFTIQIGDDPPRFYINTGKLEAIAQDEYETITLQPPTEALLPADIDETLRKVRSRSLQKRVAIQRGEPMPSETNPRRAAARE